MPGAVDSAKSAGHQLANHEGLPGAGLPLVVASGFVEGVEEAIAEGRDEPAGRREASPSVGGRRHPGPIGRAIAGRPPRKARGSRLAPYGPLRPAQR